MWIGVVVSSVGKSLVVPREHESILVVPPLSELAAIVAVNRQVLSTSKVDLNGVPLGSLRSEAQADVLEAATSYTSTLLGDSVSSGALPLIVTGHQPELFHAGVWAKNFASAGLASQTGGTALNLVIDNDTIEGTRIRVPVGSRQSPAIEWIPFDQAPAPQPWEESMILDRDCFQSFGKRVSQRIRECWNYEPLVEEAWPAAIRQAAVTAQLGDCLTAARVAVERSHGLRNLDIPMSRVCRSRSFCQFTAFLLAHLPRFHSTYNDSVHAYRVRHGLRSHTHPVPDLAFADGWYEAPFWIWRAGDQRRERPLARQVGSEIHIRDSREVLVRLPLAPDQPLDPAATGLAEMGERGIRLRSRALTTTLFARLFMADLFIHGIGGATYDTMTDEICQQFLGINPPPYATVSATAHLPLPSAYPVTTDDLTALNQRIRRLRYNPDRTGEFSQAVTKTLVAEKQDLLAGLGRRRPTRTEHQRLGEINRELFSHLQGVQQSLTSSRNLVLDHLRANSILKDREFSWCVQPDSAVGFFRREFKLD